jgi:hypothetical protein
MDDADLEKYRGFLNPERPPFDIVVGFEPPDKAYKAGYPSQLDQQRPAVLVPAEGATLTTDWSQGPYKNNHYQWRLVTAVSRGESGSPVFDSNGNVFAILLDQANDDSNKGIALNLTEVVDILQDVFKSMKLTSTGLRLRDGLLRDNYPSEDKVAGDLVPSSLSNKELAAVILAVTSSGPPRFRYKHCPVDVALVQRNLGLPYSYWEPDDQAVDATVHSAYLLQDATGLAASGQTDRAALRYAAAYQTSSREKTSNRDPTVEMSAALGAARAYEKLNQPGLVKTYATLALQTAHRVGSKEHVALANTYLFYVALAENDPKTARVYAKAAFVQAPNAVYNTFSTINQKEEFRLKGSITISAEEWKHSAAAMKATLEPTLLGNTVSIVTGKTGKQ